MNLNNCTLIGRLTKDAEFSIKEGKKRAKFYLAVSKYEDEVDFFPCHLYGEYAEKIHKYLTKGKLVSVVGEMHLNQYEQEGENKTYPLFHVTQLYLLEKKALEEQTPE